MGPALTGQWESCFRGPDRADNQIIGLALNILDSVTVGLAGMEQEQPATGPAGLDPTEICNHLQSSAIHILKYAKIGTYLKIQHAILQIYAKKCTNM